MPQLENYFGKSQKPPAMSTVMSKLCLYHQLTTGQSQVVIGGANFVKFSDSDGLSPRSVAENVATCFSDVPAGGEWSGVASVDEVRTCPFNSESPGLNGHVVCPGTCDNKFTQGKTYQIRIASTLASPTVAFPDFCIFYEEVPSA
jgi:hypothetical protein